MTASETLPRKIGVISDTHGLLRPEAVEALRGVDLIIHAGDVGDPAILADLERIAPVHAVRGNVDREAWARALPSRDTIQVGSVLVHVLHIEEEIDLDPVAAGIGVIIFGHTHRPLVERRRGVLFLNPGSAGPRRFSLPVSLAFLDVDGSDVSAEIRELV
ncbi:MAG TPA: metallophosphoesterase family protein [Planctomycetota bacterium]|nr:metallophosphoesterase family protein [Planctomycetota bacterium]